MRVASSRIAACGLVTTSVGRGREAEFAQMRGDRRIRARGVVRDVAEPPAVAAAVEAVDRVRQRAGAGVDHAVEVGEHDVDAIQRRRAPRRAARTAPSVVLGSPLGDSSAAASSSAASTPTRRRSASACDRRLVGSGLFESISSSRIDRLLEDRLDADDSRHRSASRRAPRRAGATPRASLVAAELLEHGRARREQRRAPLEGTIRIELGDVELLQRALGLAEIEARARHGDRELDPHGGGELVRSTARPTSSARSGRPTPRSLSTMSAIWSSLPEMRR